MDDEDREVIESIARRAERAIQAVTIVSARLAVFMDPQFAFLLSDSAMRKHWIELMDKGIEPHEAAMRARAAYCA